MSEHPGAGRGDGEGPGRGTDRSRSCGIPRTIADGSTGLLTFSVRWLASRYMVGLVRRRRIVGITTTIDRAPALKYREYNSNIEGVEP